MTNKINIKALILIVVSSVILAIIYNSFSDDGIPFIREPLIVKTVNIISDENNSEELQGLNLDQVVKLHSNKTAIFIDARDQWEYSNRHIAGAINIPEFSFTPEDKTLTSVSKESLIIVYCDGDNCDTSKRLAEELMKLGYKKMYVYLGGFKEWMEADLPIESGEKL